LFLKQKSSVVAFSCLEGLIFGTSFTLHEADLKRSTSMSSNLLTSNRQSLPDTVAVIGVASSVLRIIFSKDQENERPCAWSKGTARTVKPVDKEMSGTQPPDDNFYNTVLAICSEVFHRFFAIAGSSASARA
jgi:hypothetical protein